VNETLPPTEVLLAFVRELNETVTGFEEPHVVLVRGSLLLRLWYGNRARPAGDLDLECFAGPPFSPDPDDEDFVPEPGTFGRHGEFVSLVDFAKAMCRYAAWGTADPENYRDSRPQAIRFTRTDAPAGETSLYVYGTPGERYFTGWEWPARGLSGLLQIDVSAEGDLYALDDLPTIQLPLAAPDGTTVACPAYAPETMLAAKVSWLMRSFKRVDGRLSWAGEPKDLFDAHLLLTAGDPGGGWFRKALTAFGRQDRLAWVDLDHLFTDDLTDADFANWPAFVTRYPGLEPLPTVGPADMLRTVAARLEPLLADFYPRAEMPFLRTIVDAPADPLPKLVYADWLDERGDEGRAAFLRGYAAGEAVDFAAQPPGWLHQLFGTSAALQKAR
jgi:uncharacterized protein (TIGR02996 family)